MGLSFFGALFYLQYYTFAILSEKFKSFSIQESVYIILSAKVLGRMTFIFVLLCTNRRTLNFLISGTILLLSSTILGLSFFVDERTLDLLGIFFSGGFSLPNRKC